MSFTQVLLALKEGLDPTALVEAATAAAPPPATLHLVTLVRVGTHEDEPERVATVEEELAALAAELERQGYETRTESRLMAVSAATDLIAIAEEHECDLVVIGLAKRSRVGKALMGSDAQRVLLSASCPVLSVHIS